MKTSRRQCSLVTEFSYLLNSITSKPFDVHKDSCRHKAQKSTSRTDTTYSQHSRNSGSAEQSLNFESSMHWTIWWITFESTKDVRSTLVSCCFTASMASWRRLFSVVIFGRRRIRWWIKSTRRWRLSTRQSNKNWMFFQFFASCLISLNCSAITMSIPGETTEQTMNVTGENTL